MRGRSGPVRQAQRDGSRSSGDITANDAAIAFRPGCAVVPGVLIHTGPRQYSLGDVNAEAHMTG
jgi:hypothetical protein